MTFTDSEPQGRVAGNDSSAAARRPLDVVVIGAGQAGLAMAWFLARRGVRYLLVDSNPEVGAAWRSRWDSLRLFSSAQYDGLPGSEFPAAAEIYPGKDDVADFLASYAERNAFPILTSTTVTRMIRQAVGFAVHTTQGTIAARQVSAPAPASSCLRTVSPEARSSWAARSAHGPARSPSKVSSAARRWVRASTRRRARRRNSPYASSVRAWLKGRHS